MGKVHKKEATRYLIGRYVLISIGATLAAIALEQFLIPNSVIDGGIIGISLIINFMTGIPFGILILIINMPF